MERLPRTLQIFPSRALTRQSSATFSFGRQDMLFYPTTCITFQNRQYTRYNALPLPQYFRIPRRQYANTSRDWGMNRVQYTKYRIAKPWTTDTQFDDLILADPSKEDFAKYVKEIPLFLRFLKLVTDLESRQKVFVDFARRCEGGLSVEKDVYITKKELVDCLWSNGYSEQEISAFEIAFPTDYHFHYPELAVLFDLSEEDCYQYCLRQRAASPQKLIEVKYKKPTNLLSSYGLSFLGVWFGLSNTVLSNMWFYAKTFPFGAVFFMLASNFSREIKEYMWKEERAMISAAKKKKDDGEEIVFDQIKRYANDAKCFDYLSNLREEVHNDVSRYRQSVVIKLRKRMTEALLQKLVTMEQAEKSIQASLQEVMVLQIVSAFTDLFQKNSSMQDDAFRSALDAISGRETQLDPVGVYFKNSLQELQKVDVAKIPPNANGTVVERIAASFRLREKTFLDAFTIKVDEAKEVQQIGQKCKLEGRFDVSSLAPVEKKRLDELYSALTKRLGFDCLHEDELLTVGDTCHQMESFVSQINKQIDVTREILKNARLQAFVKAFV